MIVSGDAGGWLLGGHGVRRIVELSAIMKAKALDAVIARTGKSFGAYSPWMNTYLMAPSPAIERLMAVATRRGRLEVDQGTLALIEQVVCEATDGAAQAGLGFWSKHGIGIAHLGEDLAPVASGQYDRAFMLLCNADPEVGAIASGLVDVAVPLDVWNNSASSHVAKGAIFVSLERPAPTARAALAIRIAHEVAHQAIMVYQSADPILASSPLTPIYSGVRRTVRPAIQSFHALAALRFMLRAAEAIVRCPDATTDERRFCGQEADKLSLQAHLGAAALKDLQFTELGSHLARELHIAG